jgi:hypothetical protein
MFRRRPFRRPHPRRRPPRGPSPLPAGPRVRNALQQAHLALQRGDTTKAARIFLRLAQAAARRGMPARAAAMALQAARAEARGGKAERAAEHAARALAFFADAPLPERIAASAEQLVQALREGGHEKEAAQVEKRLEDGLSRSGTTRQEIEEHFTAARAQRKGKLPPKCSACGGPLLPDEVAWHGPDAAECPYCGSVVQTE